MTKLKTKNYPKRLPKNIEQKLAQTISIRGASISTDGFSKKPYGYFQADINSGDLKERIEKAKNIIFKYSLNFSSVLNSHLSSGPIPRYGTSEYENWDKFRSTISEHKSEVYALLEDLKFLLSASDISTPAGVVNDLLYNVKDEYFQDFLKNCGVSTKPPHIEGLSVELTSKIKARENQWSIMVKKAAEHLEKEYFRLNNISPHLTDNNKTVPNDGAYVYLSKKLSSKQELERTSLPDATDPDPDFGRSQKVYGPKIKGKKPFGKLTVKTLEDLSSETKYFQQHGIGVNGNGKKPLYPLGLVHKDKDAFIEAIKNHLDAKESPITVVAHHYMSSRKGKRHWHTDNIYLAER